ncbi:MAG: OmpA family protein [Pseudomarimonas sp.]
MTQNLDACKRVMPVLLLAILLASCATTKPGTDATGGGEPADTATPSAGPITPAAVPPVAPVNPMLVASTDYSTAREQRRLALSKSSNALPAGEQGYYLDVLYAQLRQVLGVHAEVERSEGSIRVVLPPTVTFEVASATLAPDAKTALSAILSPLRDYQSLLISVHGHTDSSGPAEVNQRLSAQRALTVAEQLRALNFPANQLMAIGHGASQPSADNSTAEGRQINRRVELLLEAIGGGE